MIVFKLTGPNSKCSLYKTPADAFGLKKVFADINVVSINPLTPDLPRLNKRRDYIGFQTL